MATIAAHLRPAPRRMSCSNHRRLIDAIAVRTLLGQRHRATGRRTLNQCHCFFYKPKEPHPTERALNSPGLVSADIHHLTHNQNTEMQLQPWPPWGSLIILQSISYIQECSRCNPNVSIG